MSVRPVDAQRSFYHTDYLAGNLFGSVNRYRLFREKIWPKLLELGPKLDALYCAENGRPPIDPVLLCGVTLLQFMERAADRRASEQVVYHLGWKYALDLALDYGGFHSTVLVYFRDRLEEKTAERMIFDRIVQLLVELGLVKKKGKQRIDSTHVVGYVKAMSWMECAIETLRLGLEDLAYDAGMKKRPEFWGRLWEFYVESNLDWRLSKTEQANRHRHCGQDIRDLLEWIDRTDPKLAEREAVKLLRRVFGEAHTGKCVSGNNDDHGLQTDVFHGRSEGHTDINAIGITQLKGLAGKTHALGLAGEIAKGIDTAHVTDVRLLQRGKNCYGLGTHLLSEIAAREQVVAAQASAGYYTLGSRDQLQHGFIMGSDPAGQKLSVSELASPVKIGGAVQEDLALLGEYVSGSRILSFHNQHGLTNLRILVGLGQEFRFQTQ